LIFAANLVCFLVATSAGISLKVLYKKPNLRKHCQNKPFPFLVGNVLSEDTIRQLGLTRTNKPK